MSSTPCISEFNPHAVPYQHKVIKDVRKHFDYNKGVHEVLLSGSVGSAKSLLMAHLLITHCLQNEKARVCLGRKAMPDLKDTILARVLEHMDGDLVEGEDYEHNETKAQIIFSNGSEIISRSWADKKYKKFRSLELSAAAIEELTENTDDDKQAYEELKMRVGRLQHVKENFMVAATNPDSPAHWVHKYFIDTKIPTRHVYYSVTTENKFLPEWYVSQLLNDLDPKMARRMIYGEWIEISGEVIYYNYDKTINRIDKDYAINTAYPIRISFDFNVAENKPMSAVLFQYINDEFHWFDEIIIQGARTEGTIEDAIERGLLDYETKYIIHGDATGKARNPASKVTNYDIIRSVLSNYKNKKGQLLNFEVQVPLSNPPIRKRHNLMNGYFKNALGKVRSFVYRKAKTLDEGFRLTKLKKGADYIEDDSKPFQHVTTAAGYGLVSALSYSQTKPQGTVEM